MSRTIILLFALVGFAVAGYFIFQFGLAHAPGTSNNYGAVAATWATLLTSLLTAIITLFTAFRTSRMNEELEGLKRKLDAEWKANEALFSAAAYYYRVLSKMETLKITSAQVALAEDKMTEAEGQAIFRDEAYRNLWFEIWQSARTIGEEALLAADQALVWRNKAKVLGQQIKILQGMAAIQS